MITKIEQLLSLLVIQLSTATWLQALVEEDVAEAGRVSEDLTVFKVKHDSQLVDEMLQLMETTTEDGIPGYPAKIEVARRDFEGGGNSLATVLELRVRDEETRATAEISLHINGKHAPEHSSKWEQTEEYRKMVEWADALDDNVHWSVIAAKAGYLD